jgi:ABC-type Mn2+/Zn2+ transport system ATPase subunit
MEEAVPSNLSGGNQQKVAIARLLLQGCEICWLDEPTRGVDVGSKKQIYQVIASLARCGRAVLIVSSDLAELYGICDRLAVMSRRYLSPARPIEEWTPESALQAAMGTDLKGTPLSGAKDNSVNASAIAALAPAPKTTLLRRWLRMLSPFLEIA